MDFKSDKLPRDIKFLLGRIEDYIENRFGSLLKNDFEVMFFQYMLLNKLEGKDNYTISEELRIPEAKIKRLRYEASLKYKGIIDDKSDYDKLKEALVRVKFRKDNNRLQFVIEDISVRKFLDHLLKEEGRFTDTSFNKEIVTIEFPDLLTIYKAIPEGKKDLLDILKVAKKELDGEITIETVFNGLLKGVQEGYGLKDHLANLSIMGITHFIKQYKNQKLWGNLNDNKKRNI